MWIRPAALSAWKLREDAKFSDGSAVTASDVRYTILQIQRLGSDSPYYHDVAKIQSVSATGSRTLTITFERVRLTPLFGQFDLSCRRRIQLRQRQQQEYEAVGRIATAPYDRVKCLKLKPNKNYFTAKRRSTSWNCASCRTRKQDHRSDDHGRGNGLRQYQSGRGRDAEDKKLKSEKISLQRGGISGLLTSKKIKVLAEADVAPCHRQSHRRRL